MLDAGEDTAYTYVFAGVVPALAIVTLAVAGDGVAVREAPEGIVSEAAHAALAPAAAQARSSLVDPMAAWGELATPRGGRRSSTTTDGGLASSRANRGGRSDSRHVVGGEEDGEGRRTCEAKARSNSSEIREQEQSRRRALQDEREVERCMRLGEKTFQTAKS
jgi:hypothetical protein